MPRIMVDGSWYDPVAAKSLYENDYELALTAHAKTLFPGYRCVPFKVRVDSEYGTGKPDLALIDESYRSWYIVEVELDTHPLKSHVEEQVRKFAFGKYTETHLDHVARKAPGLDGEKLRSMLLGDQPRVLVLVTSEQPTWTQSLAQYGAQVGVIEIFRDDLDRVIFRVDGDQPRNLEHSFISDCTQDQLLPRALRLGSPAPLMGLDRIDLLLEGQTSSWKILRAADTAWITPIARSPFDEMSQKRFQIFKQNTGEFVLKGVS